MTISEKVAYIKGLAEGMKLDADKDENKLILNILDVLADLATDLEDTECGLEELSEQVDAVDEDLDALETEFYDECDDCCGCDDDLYEITCPACETEFEVDEDTLLDGSIECPNCGETLEFDIECEDGECDECDCGCEDKE